jgi:nicotinic acid phosphoribosyltransferase
VSAASRKRDDYAIITSAATSTFEQARLFSEPSVGAIAHAIDQSFVI